MKEKTITKHWFVCDFCGDEYEYDSTCKEQERKDMAEHEERCQSNPKNDPCPKCKGSGKNWLTYGEYHIKYHGEDPKGPYSTKTSPMMEEDCPKCKGTGKGFKTRQQEKLEKIKEKENRWW